MVVLSLVVVVIAGCRSNVQSAQPQALTTTGTTAVTTAITTAAPPVSLSGNLKIAGSTSIQPLSTQLANAFMQKYPNVKVTVVGGSTGSGLEFAQNGSADIGAVSRVLTAAEMSTYKNYLIAMEGVVIIVNPSNKVASLTMDQARQIFDGQITNWQDVGGGNATIDLFIRERGASARAVFQDILMSSDSFSTSAGIQTSTEAYATPSPVIPTPSGSFPWAIWISQSRRSPSRASSRACRPCSTAPTRSPAPSFT